MEGLRTTSRTTGQQQTQRQSGATLWMRDLGNDRRDEAKLYTFLHKCLRRLLKIYLPMRVTNEEGREEPGLAPSVSRLGDGGGAG